MRELAYLNTFPQVGNLIKRLIAQHLRANIINNVSTTKG